MYGVQSCEQSLPQGAPREDLLEWGMAAIRLLSLSAALGLAACGSTPSANRGASAGAGPEASTSNASALSAGESAASADPNGALKAALGVVGTRKLYIENINSLMLFADERLEAQTMIAAWASAVGFAVIDPATVARTLEQSAAGMNPTTGEQCGPPLDRRWATNRWMGELGSAGHFEAAIYCQPDCALQLSLHLDSQGTEFFAAPFNPSAPWREELDRSLRMLKDNGGHGRHGHLNNPVEVAGSKRTSELGDLVLDQADMRPAPQALLDKAAACGADETISQLLVEKTAESAVRCEGIDTGNYAASTDAVAAACLCEALQLQEPTARGVLRVAPPTPSAAVEKTTSGLKLRASIFKNGIYGEEPWTERMFFADCDDDHNCDDVGSCFTQRSAPLASTRLGVTVSFDKDGLATGAAIADFKQLLQPDEHACVVKKLTTLRIPCPDAPSSSRKAKLDLEIEDMESEPAPAKSP
jgi:hypothetical protein